MTTLREAAQQALEALEYRTLDVGKFNRINAACQALRAALAEPVQEPVAWHVCSVNSDGTLSLEYAAAWAEAAHEHINDAINEHDIADAGSWVVRPVYASPQPQRTEPSQDIPQQRPHTPVGWSDTDWLAHLSTMPPIGYAVRDTLYGTSKAGVLRFCPSTESGAFAVYAAPPQRKPLTEEQVYAALSDQVFWATSRNFILRVVRDVERAHGIGGAE